MWFHHQTKQPTLYLVIDDNQAALITWDIDVHTIQPFVMTSYSPLPNEWFLHGAPWHLSSFTTYLRSYITQHRLKKPLLVCACSGATSYEKTITLTHAPTQAAIPPDKSYAHYAWHATSLPTQTELSQNTTSYLINGIPHNDILRLRLCTDKSGCILHRVTTLRASMQTLYTYCQQHGITPENTTFNHATITKETEPCPNSSCSGSCTHETIHPTTPTLDQATHETTTRINTIVSPKTLLTMLCAPLPETHNHDLVLSALGLSLFERNHL